jgi:hypothetical protein
MICGRTMDPFFHYRTRGVLTECTLTNFFEQSTKWGAGAILSDVYLAPRFFMN